MKRTFPPVCAAIVLSLTAPFLAGAEAWVGAWSAPSLSDPSVPIVVRLLPEGKATEQIGDYRGNGIWKIEGNSARILWSSRWMGLLRSKPDGTCELLTWKKGSSPDGSPDDIQPARRITDTDR